MGIKRWSPPSGVSLTDVPHHTLLTPLASEGRPREQIRAQRSNEHTSAHTHGRSQAHTNRSQFDHFYVNSLNEIQVAKFNLLIDRDHTGQFSQVWCKIYMMLAQLLCSPWRGEIWQHQKYLYKFCKESEIIFLHMIYSNIQIFEPVQRQNNTFLCLLEIK